MKNTKKQVFYFLFFIFKDVNSVMSTLSVVQNFIEKQQTLNIKHTSKYYDRKSIILNHTNPYCTVLK